MLFHPVQQFLWKVAELGPVLAGFGVTASALKGSYRPHGCKSRRPHRDGLGAIRCYWNSRMRHAGTLTQKPPESERPEARGSQGCEGHSGNGSWPGGRDRFEAESFESEEQVVSWGKWHKDISLTESTEISGPGPSQKPGEEAARTGMAHTNGQNSSRTKKGSRSMIQL